MAVGCGLIKGVQFYPVDQCDAFMPLCHAVFVTVALGCNLKSWMVITGGF